MKTQNIAELKEKLKVLLREKALKRGDFVLSSGKKSNYYLDGRLVTLLPQGAYLSACIILQMIKSEEIDAVGGPTIGADPIVGAVAAIAYEEGFKISTFIVRKSAKEHGMSRLIEGPELKKGSKVILFDDVATTGKALLEAKEALEKQGVEVKKAIVLVDRLEGASLNLEKAGLKLDSVFTIKDLGI